MSRSHSAPAWGGNTAPARPAALTSPIEGLEPRRLLTAAHTVWSPALSLPPHTVIYGPIAPKSLRAVPAAGGNQAPTIVTAPAAGSAVVIGTDCRLTVLGADDSGEAALTYTWAVSGTPPAPVTFLANGTNAAKATTVRLTQAGTYTFVVTVSDGSLSTTGSVTVQVSAKAVLPDVQAFTIDDGTAQRSNVRRLTLTFNAPVTLDPTALSLTQTAAGVSTPVLFTTATADGGTTYRLTPTSSTTTGSLNDGAYTLIVHAMGVHSLYSPTVTMIGVDRTYAFSRIFGDANGDGVVNFSDFLQLQGAFGATVGSTAFVPGLDSDNNGVINFTDFLALQGNFGKTAEAAPAASTLPVNGVSFKYYEGTWTTLPNFSTLTPVKSGLTHNFDPSIRKRDTNYAFVWSANLTVAQAGSYTFYTGSDDGSALFVDGQRVVNNDGTHVYTEAAGAVNLSAGVHSIVVQYFQAGGGQQFSASYAGPGIAKQPIGDAVLTTTAPGNVYVHDYGAVGDGTTNDSTAIQAAIAAAPDGATLVFDAGKTYRLNTGLKMDRPLNVEGNGATLLLNTSSYPANETVYWASPLASSAYTWTQTVKAGQTTFNVSASTDALLPGDTVFLQLGTDPNDSTQPNWGEVCQVVANTGSTVTVNIPVPYDISQGSRANSIQRITDVAQNVSFKDVNFNYVAGQTPDANLWLERVRNVAVSNLTGQFTIMANIVDSQIVNVSGCQGTLHKLASSSGRMITSWQMDGLNVVNNTMNASADAAVVFLESWAHHVLVDGLTVNNTYGATSSQDVFHLTGNSYDNFIDDVTVNNTGSINLVLSGTQPASFRLGTVNVTGAIKSAPLANIAELTNGGHTYDALQLHTTTFVVPINANMGNYTVPLCSGMVESMSFTLSSLTGVNQIYVTNSNGTGMQLIGSLTAGKTAIYNQFFGSDYPFDSPTTPDKKIQINTGSTVAAGTTLTVSVSYY